MKRLIILLLAVTLMGCDLIGGSSSSTTTVAPKLAEVTWTNMVPVANTYDISSVILTLEDYINYGKVGATSNVICVVVWETSTSALASCRNITLDGQWPATCTANELSGSVNCGEVVGTVPYFISAMGESRTLSVEEAELADEIRRKTYCTAPRRDASTNPCVIS